MNGSFPGAEARRERPVLLHFWFTECAPCKNDYPVLRELKERYHVVGIHLPTEDVDKVRRAIAGAEMNYPTMIAPASENPMLVARFPVSSFPTCILTDESGYVTRFGSLEEVLRTGR